MTEAKSKTQTVRERLDPSRVDALNTLLHLEDIAPHPFAHQVYFWDVHPASALGRDGHPKTGGLIPDMGLPRRMWAGGRLRFHAALRLGELAEKRSKLGSAERKVGRSGPLALITLMHEVHQDGQLIVEEEQDLVYLPDPDPQAEKPKAPAAPDLADHVTGRQFSTTDLFRYSALTFNGHRIHYDREYSQQVEGYPGLVVHGPLLAQCLMLQAEEILGELCAFDFRATAPLFDFETAEFCARKDGAGLEMWVRGPDGRQCMRAQAR